MNKIMLKNEIKFINSKIYKKVPEIISLPDSNNPSTCLQKETNKNILG